MKKLALFSLFSLLVTSRAAHAVNSPALESYAVWRMQVKFHTGTSSNDGTDNRVWVMFNGLPYFLDRGGNDREPGQWDSYDVAPSLVGVSRISDINWFIVGKGGTDGWAYDRVQIFINGDAAPIFDSTGRVWLDAASGDTASKVYSSTTLRANGSWVLGRQGALIPTTISAPSLENMIEGLIGHLKIMYAPGTYWPSDNGNGEWVTVTRRNTTTAAVDLDLAYSASCDFLIDWCPDPAIDVDFDLGVSCSNGKLRLDVRNIVVDVDLAWWVDVLSLSLLDNLFELAINSALGNISLSLGTPICPRSTTFDASGNLVIAW